MPRKALRHYIRVANTQSVRERMAKLREEERDAEEITAIARGNKEFCEGSFIDLSRLRRRRK